MNCNTLLIAGKVLGDIFCLASSWTLSYIILPLPHTIETSNSKLLGNFLKCLVFKHNRDVDQRGWSLLSNIEINTILDHTMVIFPAWFYIFWMMIHNDHDSELSLIPMNPKLGSPLLRPCKARREAAELRGVLMCCSSGRAQEVSSKMVIQFIQQRWWFNGIYPTKWWFNGILPTGDIMTIY